MTAFRAPLLRGLLALLLLTAAAGCAQNLGPGYQEYGRYFGPNPSYGP